MYILEVPSGGVTNPESHIYDEFFLVIEGRGTTEVWRKRRQEASLRVASRARCS